MSVQLKFKLGTFQTSTQ
jgi:hypothetical protein